MMGHIVALDAVKLPTGKWQSIKTTNIEEAIEIMAKF